MLLEGAVEHADGWQPVSIVLSLGLLILTVWVLRRCPREGRPPE